MIIQDIASMPAGHDIDLLIYERVFGQKILTREEMICLAMGWWKDKREIYKRDFSAQGGFWADWAGQKNAYFQVPIEAISFEQTVPCYSTSLSDAYLIAEKVYRIDTSYFTGNATVGDNPVLVARAAVWANEYGGSRASIADTLPLAICRATLMAIK